jgi:predicted LPLAT superfamily acyltransferase
MKPLVAIVAGWYWLFDPRARRASRDWLRRVQSGPVRRRQVFRHIRTFAQVTLDRVFLLTGKDRGLELTRTGHEHLSAQLATGRGAILLGAHLGSYEAMRAGGAHDDVPIHIVGHFANARRINAVLSRLSPGRSAQVIHVGDDPVGVMARVRARVEAGDLVALLGDRIGLGDRVVRVPFLGEEALFPAGPFLIAHVLRCPVFLVFGLYTDPGRYDLHCEPFAERVELPRAGREEALQAVVRRYAARLEHHARGAPYNWFNFFDFWKAA